MLQIFPFLFVLFPFYYSFTLIFWLFRWMLVLNSQFSIDHNDHTTRKSHLSTLLVYMLNISRLSHSFVAFLSFRHISHPQNTADRHFSSLFFSATLFSFSCLRSLPSSFSSFLSFGSFSFPLQCDVLIFDSMNSRKGMSRLRSCHC